MKPMIEWKFSVRSPSIDRRSTVLQTAPIDADVHELRQGLLDIGYDCIYLAGKEWTKYAWPGGYEVHLCMEDGGTICAECAEDREVRQRTMDPDQPDREWRVTALDVNYEYDDLYCDHCNQKVKPAYGDSDEGGETDDAWALASAGYGTDEDYGGDVL